MAAAAFRVSLVALAALSVAACGQNTVVPAPSTAVAVDRGTAILDAMGIDAGQPIAPNGNIAAALKVVPE